MSGTTGVSNQQSLIPVDEDGKPLQSSFKHPEHPFFGCQSLKAIYQFRNLLNQFKGTSLSLLLFALTCGGNFNFSVTSLSKKMGVERTTVHRWIKDLIKKNLCMKVNRSRRKKGVYDVRYLVFFDCPDTKEYYLKKWSEKPMLKKCNKADDTMLQKNNVEDEAMLQKSNVGETPEKQAEKPRQPDTLDSTQPCCKNATLKEKQVRVNNNNNKQPRNIDTREPVQNDFVVVVSSCLTLLKIEHQDACKPLIEEAVNRLGGDRVKDLVRFMADQHQKKARDNFVGYFRNGLKGEGYQIPDSFVPEQTTAEKNEIAKKNIQEAIKEELAYKAMKEKAVKEYNNLDFSGLRSALKGKKAVKEVMPVSPKAAAKPIKPDPLDADELLKYAIKKIGMDPSHRLHRAIKSGQVPYELQAFMWDFETEYRQQSL